MIKIVKIKNFKGLTKDINLKLLNAFVGKNGTNKTKSIEAIIWCLTGKYEGRFEGTTEVTIGFDDDTTVTSKNEPNGKKNNFTYYLNDKKVEKSVYDEHLKNKIGAKDTLSFTSIVDVDEEALTKIVLSRMEEDFDLDKLEKMVTLDKEVILYLEKNLNPTFKSKELFELLKPFDTKRLELNRFIKEANIKLDEKNIDFNENLLKKYEEALKAAKDEYNEFRLYEKLVTNYENELKKFSGNEEKIKFLEKEIKSFKEEKFDSDLLEKEEKLEKAIISKNSEIAVAKNDGNNLFKMMKQLQEAGGTCIVSVLTNCEAGKCANCKEILETLKRSIEERKAIYNQLKKDLEALEKDLDKVKKTLEKKRKYELKLKGKEAKEEQLRLLKELPKPEKPVAKAFKCKTDKEYEDTITHFEKLIRECEESKNNKKLFEEMQEKTKEANILDTLCRALKPNGIISNAIGEYYVKKLNKLLKIYETENHNMTLELKYEDLIRYYITINNKTLSWNELSKGEKVKAYMLLSLVICLITDTKILFVDEISVLDAENLKSVLDIMEKNFIIQTVMTGVDFKEIVDTLNKAKIETIKF